MPQPTVVMQVEGVLRKPITGAVIDSGRRLYLGLAQFYRVVLVTEETDHDLINGWLNMHSFTRHDHIVYGDVDVSTARSRWVSIAKMLRHSYGYDVDLCVLPDPAEAARLIEIGFSTMLFTKAAYALPEWRPDHRKGVQPWLDLVGEVQHQQTLRADDRRMEDDLR